MCDTLGQQRPDSRDCRWSHHHHEIFAKAWRREQFGLGGRLWRGATWSVLYLAMIGLREQIALCVGRVVTACVGAVLWERTAPTDTVIDSQAADAPNLLGERVGGFSVDSDTRGGWRAATLPPRPAAAHPRRSASW